MIPNAGSCLLFTPACVKSHFVSHSPRCPAAVGPPCAVYACPSFFFFPMLCRDLRKVSENRCLYLNIYMHTVRTWCVQDKNNAKQAVSTISRSAGK